MAETAFSKQFNRELDPEQYAQLLGPYADIHSSTRADVICPICKAGGASYVTGTIGQKARKAHFRFTSETGASAHHPLCDFYDDKLSTDISDKLVQFSKDRTALSAVVRHRVCAGIQEGMFSQHDIWNMRSWFFELRSKYSIPINLPEQDIKWLHYLREFLRTNIILAGNYAFHPVQANMPRFVWKQAIATEFYRVHQNTFDQLHVLNRNTHVLSYLDEIVKLMERGLLPKSIVDPQVLASAYKATGQLTSFITLNDPELRYLDKSTTKDGLKRKFRAFAALILYTSGWDMNVATEKYIRLVRIKQVDDMLAGNIIGLDLFKDYQSSIALLELQKGQISFNRKSANTIEQEMRNSYLQYSETHVMPPLPPPIYQG